MKMMPTLDAKVESLRKELLDHKGSPVLVCSDSEGNGVPALFVIGDVVMLGTKRVLKRQRGTNRYFNSGPLIAIGNIRGALYQLVGNEFVLDRENSWGRNHFPNVGSYLAFGRESVLNVLKKECGYEGELPDFV